MKKIILYLLCPFVFGCSNQTENKKLNDKIDSLSSVNSEYKKRIDFEDLPTSYGIELLQTGGIGSHNVQLQAFYTIDIGGYYDNPKERITYFFNNGGYYIWIQPILGYRIKEVNKDIDGVLHRVECEDDTSCPLLLENVLQNKFLIIMNKTDYKQYLEDIREDKKLKGEKVN